MNVTHFSLLHPSKALFAGADQARAVATAATAAAAAGKGLQSSTFRLNVRTFF
jgi:hypothetical protein